MFDFFKKLLGMSRACPDCSGRGRWQENITGADGLTEVRTYYCETCHGRGILTNDEDIDDFDLAGVGTTEFDENEED